MGGRERGGACNMIKHVDPSPPLPRKRGREQTELAAPTDSISPTAFARTSRGVRKKSHDGLSVHGETARDADRLAGDVGGVIGQQEGDEPGIILRHPESPHRDGPLEPFGDAGAVGAFEKAAENGGGGRAGADPIGGNRPSAALTSPRLSRRSDSALSEGGERLPPRTAPSR